jgi:hypothetical protein
MRGLDGSRPVYESKDTSGTGQASQRQRPDRSALEKWVDLTADVNRAEGDYQFDYLTRLAGRMEALETLLERSGNGRIAAIGIVGADVYDKLLILKALRDRFPQALFFTTELDARLWHPDELAHSRNLIVASGFGLELRRNLMERGAPFRDGLHTGLHAAMLHALSLDESDPIRLARKGIHAVIKPRVFEVGRNGPVDMSTMDHPLHPPLRGDRDAVPSGRTIVAGWVAVLSLIGLLVWKLRPLYRITFGASQDAASQLAYEPEDFGGDLGIDEIVKFLKGYRSSTEGLGVGERQGDLPGKDPGKDEALFRWVREEVLVNLLKEDPETLQLESAKSSVGTDGGGDGGRVHRQLYKEGYERVEFVEAFNGVLRGISRWVPREVLQELVEGTDDREQARLVREEVLGREKHQEFVAPFIGSSLLGEMLFRRRTMDLILDRIDQRRRHGLRLLGGQNGREDKEMVDTGPKDCWEAAKEAREAGMSHFRIRRRELGVLSGILMMCLIAVGILAWVAWGDTFVDPLGEPFSLWNGTSAWPTEFLRLVVVGLTSGLVWHGYCQLRRSTLRITRRFALRVGQQRPLFSMRLPMTVVPSRHVRAIQLWDEYQQRDHFLSRLSRIWLPALLYMGFGLGVILVGQFPAAPIRGHLNLWIDSVILVPYVLLSVLLAFWTMDAAQLARWLIEHLIEAPTVYPPATMERYGKKFGEFKLGLDEWLDIELIADLTENVGRLIYYPSLVFLVMLISRDAWWDRWPWPTGLMAVFICNFGIAAVSVLILQRSANQARSSGVARLKESLQLLQKKRQPDADLRMPSPTADLLERIEAIDRGAFVASYSSPVWPAVIIPWGGAALFSVVSQFFQ